MRYGLVHAPSGTILETCSAGYALEQMTNRCNNLLRSSDQLYYVGKLCEHCNEQVAQLKEHRGKRVYILCLCCSKLSDDELDKSSIYFYQDNEYTLDIRRPSSY